MGEFLAGSCFAFTTAKTLYLHSLLVAVSFNTCTQFCVTKPERASVVMRVKFKKKTNAGHINECFGRGTCKRNGRAFAIFIKKGLNNIWTQGENEFNLSL